MKQIDEYQYNTDESESDLKISRIWENDLYRRELIAIQKTEAGRKFCRHTPEHFLDVARLMYIETLEKGLPIPKDLIYGAALLHDIGRARQYLDGTSHEIASAYLAGRILPDCGYSKTEIETIQFAILEHRSETDTAGKGSAGNAAAGGKAVSQTAAVSAAVSHEAAAGHAASADSFELADVLSDLLYRADKKSRLCFLCDAEGDCDWPEGLKNRTALR